MYLKSNIKKQTSSKGVLEVDQVHTIYYDSRMFTKFLKPLDSDPAIKRYATFFSGTLLITVVAAIVSLFLFPLQTGLMSVFFTSFCLIPAVELILEKNKNDIWLKKERPFKANLDMALSLLTIFCAVLIAYILVTLVLTPSSIEKIFFSQIHDTMTYTHLIKTDFISILIKRSTAFAIFFSVSLIFRLGGVFIIVWLASIWGVIYGAFLKGGLNFNLPSFKHYIIVVTISGFVVLLIRTVSFITAGMAGIFLSKALEKYKFNSQEFKQVFMAVIITLLTSLILLFVSVLFEYHIYN